LGSLRRCPDLNLTRLGIKLSPARTTFSAPRSQ